MEIKIRLVVQDVLRFVVECKDPLPIWQQPATGLYPKPDKSSPHFKFLSHYVWFQSDSSIYA